MRKEIPDAERLERLRDYYHRHRCVPSYSGLARLMGYRSKAAVHKLAARLRKAGYLQMGPDKRLAPTPQFLAHRLVRSVRAGTPESPPEIRYEPFTIEGYLIDEPAHTVLVGVKGDSMIEAGILDGDVVLIDSAREARKRDIVVAMWDGQTTIKELDFDRGKPILKPHNSTMQALRPNGPIEILGVYVGLLRRHRR